MSEQEKPQEDPEKAQNDSLKDFEKSQTQEKPQERPHRKAQTYDEFKENLRSKYESVRQTGREIAATGMAVAGLSSRETLKKNIQDKFSGEKIYNKAVDIKEKVEKVTEGAYQNVYQNIEKSHNAFVAKKKAEKAETEDLQKRLKSSYKQGMEQRAYYKGFGGRADEKERRTEAKERRAQETHQIKIQKAIGGFNVGKKDGTRQSQVARPQSEPFGMSSIFGGNSSPRKKQNHSEPFGLSAFSGTQRPTIRPTQKQVVRTAQRPQRADEVLGLTSFGSVVKTSRPISSSRNPFGLNMGGISNPVGSPVGAKKGKKTQSSDFLGLKNYF